MNNSGTTPEEVLSVSFFVPLTSLLLWLTSDIFCLSIRLSSYLEVVILILILLLALTWLNNYLPLLLGTLSLFASIFLYTKLKKVSSKGGISILKFFKLAHVSDKDFSKVIVGDYRGHLLLATSICILAVDFKIFPTRFAKTETFGWSLMDAGVGSFVLLHGLCSSHGKLQLQKNSSGKYFISSLLLFLIGLIRLAFTTAVGYHKVVSEYGVHWNFFFTLALTRIFCYVVLSQLKINAGLLATFTMLIHQLFLSQVGLTDLVMSDFRRNFFESNKEGLCSLLGFASLYFWGVEIGHIMWKQRNQIEEYCLLLLKLCGIGLCGWCLMYLSHECVQPSSRRLANLTYCIWVVSLTSLQIATHLLHRLVFCVLEKLCQMRYDILLWRVINIHGLFYFLLANLLTGFVNISINTDDVSKWISFIIVFSYSVILFISSLIVFKLKTKGF